MPPMDLGVETAVPASDLFLFLRFFSFFLMWTIFKAFIESVTTLLLFYICFFGDRNVRSSRGI